MTLDAEFTAKGRLSVVTKSAAESFLYIYSDSSRSMAAARISFAMRHQRSQNLLFRRLQFLPAGHQSSHRRVRCNVSTNATAGTQDLLFKVSGRDRLGVVGQFCEILAIHDAVILDVEQAACTVHSTFSLNLLARCRTGDGMLTT